MVSPMTDALKSAKTIQSEMVQWENRREAVISEVNNLKRQAEQLEAEIIAKRTEFSVYIGDREKQVRQTAEQLGNDRKTMEIQREEFRLQLDQHLKDKATLGQEKIDFERHKAVVDGRHKMVNEFITAVRRAYNVLPD